MSGVNKGRSVQAADRAFDIVEHLLEADGARLTEVAEAMGVANSTAHNYLCTLRDRGYVVREGDVYRVGLEFLRIGGHARDQRTVNRLSRSVVERLAEETDEHAQFIVEQNGRGYHVYVAPGSRAVRVDTRAGKRIYLHANAAGKAMLAHYDEARVDEILDRWGMPAVTENTITDRAEFEACLERVRDRGYAFNLEEHILGWQGIAAPVRRHDGDVLGALAIGGPTHRLQKADLQEEFAERILECVNELELEVEFA